MINGTDTVYVESDGVIHRARVRFRDSAHIRRVADRILANIGRRVDEASPMVDARLPDGSRVNITIPPATPHGPTITIRKFRKDRYTLQQLINAGTLDDRMTEFLAGCATHGLNILVSGATGSGKTTLLNALSANIPHSERIVTIEDPLELALQQPHVVALEARPADMTGRNAISQRDLLRNTLRMRPDRIIVGEIRGGEAFEMLQAMNTGHDGSLSTVHANSPADALARVENMVLMAGFQLPARAIREQIASAIDLLVHIQRGVDGVRRVTAVTEITGMEQERLTMQDIYRFEARGRSAEGRVIGDFRPTGVRPVFSDGLRARGHELRPELFLEGVV
jgi:pilus assembly protein CpaF